MIDTASPLAAMAPPAIDTPDALQARVRTPSLPNPTLEDAFIALIEAQDRREAA